MEPETTPTAYRDRSGGLVAFGILELLLGLACLGFVPLVLLARQAPSPRAGMIPAALTYVVLALAFDWLGTGSILARRWARTLSLILGWFWLLLGFFGGVFLLYLLPRVLAAMPTGPPRARAAGFGCLAAFWSLGFVLLPFGFVLFYGSRNVRATCEARDPRPRWTDRCPAPVLALVLMSALAAVTFVAYSFHRAFPLFGRVWTGALGILLFLLLALLEAVIAWGLYHLRPVAWWGRLGLWLLNFGSSAYTFHRGVDWRQVLRASGQPENPVNLQMLQSLFASPFFSVLLAAFGVASVGYLLWVRKYFVPRPVGP